jgi:hypothetical protein
MPLLVVGGELEAIALFLIVVALALIVSVLSRCGFMSSDKSAGSSGGGGGGGSSGASGASGASASGASGGSSSAPTPRAAAPPPRDFTAAELAPETGAGGSRILVAVNGIVFDMSGGGEAFYGPGGPYACFAGHDASVGLATMELDPAKWAARAVSDFSASETDTMMQWVRRFREKYAVAGALTEGSRPTTLAQLRAEGVLPA